MKVTTLAIPDVLLLEPRVFGDARGFFVESYNRRAWAAALGRDVEFVQDNHSRSGRGVLRGLHYQVEPQSQGKLVRVTAGEVFDVAVDLRRSSATFGRWVGTRLDASAMQQLWIPPGFAHGFLVLSETADVQYKVSGYHAPAAERAIRWDDAALGIAWPLGAGERPVVSERDAGAGTFEGAELFA